MVRDSVSDGTRIGELLASELTGLQTGVLADVELVAVDEGAEPAEAGTEAYGLAHAGERVGTVSLFPEAVEVHLDGVAPPGERSDVITDSTNGATVLRIENGAAVKRAIDAIRTVLKG